jgi:hypothetical protein
MKNIILVLLSILLLVGAVACSSTDDGQVTLITGSQILTIGDAGSSAINEGFGLSGATVTLTGVYAGWSGGAPLTILNGNDHARTFHIMLQQPGASLTDGYQPFPEKYFGWFVIEDLTPTIPIGGERKVSITISVPYKFPSDMSGKKYEIRILVEDWSQTGFLQLAYQQKWLIEFA